LIPSRSSKSKFQRQEIQFLLPSYQKSQAGIESLNQLLPKNKLSPQQPIQLLGDIEHQLQQLNRCKLAEARRVEVLTRLNALVITPLEQAYTRYHNEHSVPENKNRKTLLSLCASVCQELSIGYLRVCEHDLKLSKPRFQRVRERLTLCAHRALEFIYLQQRFRALRYQVLERDCWSNVNQLIFAAFFCELHETSLEPLLCLQLHGQSNAGLINVAQLSCMIHLFAAAGVNGLPVPAINALANYIHRCRFDFDLREQTDSPGKNGVLQVSYQLDHCAEKYLPLDLQPVVQLCFNQLQLTLRSECERLISIFEQAVDDFGDQPFFNITAAEDIEKLLAVSAALNNFTKDKRREEREYVGRFNPLSLYVGYKSSFDFLALADSDDVQEQAEELNLEDDIGYGSHKSKRRSKDRAVAKRIKWTVVNRSEGGALLQSDDDEFDRNIFVGQIVVYSEADNSDECRLAYVTRLHRDYIDAKLRMAVINICHTFKAVAVQSQFLENQSLALPGILCFDYSDYPALILHTSHRLQPNTAISLRFDKQKVLHTVEDILLIKREFILYQLSQPSR